MKVVCSLAAIPIRKEASDRSEMTSQMLFGESAIVIESNEKWHLIQSEHDGYTGWVDKKQVENYIEHDLAEKKVCTAPLLIAQNKFQGYVFIPAGAMLSIINGNTIVCGSKKFTCNAGELNNATAPAELALAALIFMDTPYLWGGRTLMGLDCSGFTQLIFRIAGHSIPRDAYQQVEIGETINFIAESKTGDLAFFDNTEGKITHVGLVIKQESGDYTIIHASGKVRMDKLDHNGIFNIESGEYSHNLRTIKRIVNL